MGLNVNTAPFNINKFWDRTPTPLKYLLIIAIIVVCSYFLVSKKIDNSQIKELDKIENGIDATYDLADRFSEYQTTQNEFNDEILRDVKNVYSLVQELNTNVNTKFDYIIKNSGKYNEDLIDKLNLLNESFERLSRAYQPIQNYEPVIQSKKIEK